MNKFIGTKIISAEPEDREQGPRYKVVYEDGYISWSPKDAFEKAYHRASGMTFGQAVEAMKLGKSVMRDGWNGNGMCLQMQSPDEHSKMTFPYLYMTIPECAEGTRRLPWQPAQVDVFTEDWHIVE